MIAAAVPPAIPAHARYQKTGHYFSRGLSITFMFSFIATTIEANGMFINYRDKIQYTYNCDRQ